MTTTWRSRLLSEMPPAWAEEIDAYEQNMHLRRQGKLAEKVFAEMRLRRGMYGQRYDNGQRHDGVATQALQYDTTLLKGPGTVWDAPGMLRIKIPMGIMSARQLEVLADLSEEYADGISHVTTRQDIQLHYVHIDDSPDIMRRLAAVGITTREACGNSVRNVTACPLAGVCHEETFDVTFYAHTLAFFLLGHPDAQDFGRKFKIAFSGCAHNSCGLTSFHDLGYIAKTRVIDGERKRGFEFYIGGGLGAVPNEAQLFDEFLPESEVLPMAQAVCRVFGRLGEKNNRARARMKFLLMKLGLEEFRRLVLEERATLPHDPRWTEFLQHLSAHDERPHLPPAPLAAGAGSPAFQAWRKTNVGPQKQPGYAVVTITCPLGDLSAQQMRALADLSRTKSGNPVRATVEQNMVLRWVPEAELPSLHAVLEGLGLAEASAGTIVDVTACPGTDTCKLGHASSRGLAGELRTRMAVMNSQLDDAVKQLRIKVSGCFNSCGQHHVADLGFYGVGRKVKGYMVPHFQVILGGQWSHNGASFGLAIGAVPSKNVPDAVVRLTRMYAEGRQGNETFQEFVKRIGKTTVKKALDELTQVPAYDQDRSFYSDWGDPREFTVDDIGIGECAGEVVSATEFGLAESERRVFDAQARLEQGDLATASRLALEAMSIAARALLRVQVPTGLEQPDEIIKAFRERLHDTHVFDDPYAGPKFAHYYFRQHEEAAAAVSAEFVHHRVEEAQLFIEASYACYARVTPAAALPPPPAQAKDAGT